MEESPHNRHPNPDDPDAFDDDELHASRRDPGSMSDPPPSPGLSESDLLESDDSDIPEPTLEHLKVAMDFVLALHDASLDDGHLTEDVRHRLLEPLTHALDIGDPDIRLSLDLFLAVSNASRQTYTDSRTAILRRYPDSGVLSYDQIKQRISEWSGVSATKDDMCIHSCMAFTGPWSDLEACPLCSKARYDPQVLSASGGKVKKPRQQQVSFLLGPQLQAMYRSPEGAKAMKYRATQTAEIFKTLDENDDVLPVYDDIYSGSDLIDLADPGQGGKMKEDDILVLFSVDGCQLYRSKTSDCWIAIFVILNLAPGLRYKKKYVLPAVIIPGPKKPKNLDSCLFRTFQHLAALMRSGLKIWDASEGRVFIAMIWLILLTADGPGMTQLNGQVGHQGAHGCRTYCGLKGRRKPRGNQYCPALFKPHEYDVEGCNHPDEKPENLAPNTDAAERYLLNLKELLTATSKTQYADLRMKTGIVKPSLVMGLPKNRTLPLPLQFPIDLMHLLCLNVTELLLSLWHGTMTCDPRQQGQLGLGSTT